MSLDITLHIGAHKTASTHLQHALGRARQALAQQGVALFTPDQLRRRGLGLVEYLSGESPDPQAHATTLRAALAVSSARLILTEENILGSAHHRELILERRFYPRGDGRLRKLVTLLPAGNVTIALAIRDPAEFLVSAYGQRLASGVLQRFDAYVAGLDPADLRWSELVSRLQAAVPSARWVVWRYEDYPANAATVLQALAGPAAGLVHPSERIAHPGISAPAHSALMQAAGSLEGRGSAAVRTQVAALRARWPKGAFPGFDPFSPRAKARSAAAYVRDQARIAALPGTRALWLGSAEG